MEFSFTAGLRNIRENQKKKKIEVSMYSKNTANVSSNKNKFLIVRDYYAS